MHRRRFLGALGLAAATAGFAGCGGPAAPSSGTSTASPTAEESGGGRVVRHRYGTTSVAGSPQRVVTLGQTDHDATIALGVVPVAVGGFLGSSYSPFRPWNSAGISTEPPVLDMMEIAFEKVAALNPDLIIAAMSGVTKEDYAKLSQIAPTVAQPIDAEDWAVPYAPHTTHIGQALGRTADAERLVAELDSAFAGVRSANPALAGKTAICAELNGGDYYVLGAATPRNQFLTDVGLTLETSLAALAGKGYNAVLSKERLDLLGEVDVVIWSTEVGDQDEMLADPLVAALASTRESRYVLAPTGGNDDLLYSMDWGSILSNRFAIEQALPRVLRAADGDPVTDPNS
jgi:iron complex transport system substrate-binding protein